MTESLSSYPRAVHVWICIWMTVDAARNGEFRRNFVVAARLWSMFWERLVFAALVYDFSDEIETHPHSSASSEFGL